MTDRTPTSADTDDALSAELLQFVEGHVATAATPEPSAVRVARVDDRRRGATVATGLVGLGLLALLLILLHPELIHAGDPAPGYGPLPEVSEVRQGHFTTSVACALCHANSDEAQAMRDSQGRGVAPFDLWQSTMMANSARDPLWRAQLSVELARHPKQAANIARKCVRCHAPMAAKDAEQHDKEPLDALALLKGKDARSVLAFDGVSCTVCHQIEAKGLGSEESFTGNFSVGHDELIYGPHREPFDMPMIMHVDFQPTFGRQIIESRHCGSCHTLMTHTLNDKGEATGEVMPEQTPYLEWRNSVYSRENGQSGRQTRSCQNCHVPTRDVDGKPIRTEIAHNPGGFDFPFTEKRSPFGRHIMVGGNTLIPAMLRDNRELLRPQATDAAFNATIAEARKQLETRTAVLWAGKTTRRGDRIELPVRVVNKAGHKLPTAYPSRRVWLQVRLEDKAGKVLFRSGAFDKRGRLLGADGKVRPSELADGPIDPHISRIAAPDDVLVWESVMKDSAGKPTWSLMSAAGFFKDNRILPKGWKPDHVEARRTSPQGIAIPKKGKDKPQPDPDFLGGSDTVQLSLPAPAERGPFKLTLSLHYQTLGARHAAELFSNETAEVRQFERMYRKADTRPETLASVTVTLKK